MYILFMYLQAPFNEISARTGKKINKMFGNSTKHTNSNTKTTPLKRPCKPAMGVLKACGLHCNIQWQGISQCRATNQKAVSSVFSWKTLRTSKKRSWKAVYKIKEYPIHESGRLFKASK